MTDPAATTEVLGRDGEPCRECGAPLAADQRYCLNCGKRRGEARVDFQSHLPTAGAVGANGSAPTQEQPANGRAEATASAEKGAQRDYTPLAAVGGIAVLGIMLLIGVLIGKGDSGDTAAAPAPVILSEGATDSGKAASEEGGGEAKAGAKEAKAKGGDGGKDSGSVKGGSANTGSAPVASDDTLQQLQEGTPEEKAENSANLPDEIATPGEPPPEDNEAPGGGSKGTAIE